MNLAVSGNVNSTWTSSTTQTDAQYTSATSTKANNQLTRDHTRTLPLVPTQRECRAQNPPSPRDWYLQDSEAPQRGLATRRSTYITLLQHIVSLLAMLACTSRTYSQTSKTTTAREHRNHRKKGHQATRPTQTAKHDSLATRHSQPPTPNSAASRVQTVGTALLRQVTPPRT